jgi:hypothetical protein
MVKPGRRGGPSRKIAVGVGSGDTDIIGIDRGVGMHETDIGTKTTTDAERESQQIELEVEVQNEETGDAVVEVMSGREIGGSVGIEAKVLERKDETRERGAGVLELKNESIHEGTIGLGTILIQDHAEVGLLIVVIEKEGGTGTAIDVGDSK